MRNAQVEAGDSAPASELLGLPTEFNCWSLAALANDLDFAPSDIAVPTGAERLHGRFLCGKSAGVTLIARPSSRLAVSYLPGGEDARAKARAGLCPVDRAFDASDFDQINSSSENLRHDRIEQSINSAPTQSLSNFHALAVLSAPILLFKLLNRRLESQMAKLSITVNKSRCVGSGDCVEIAPGVFQLDADEKSEVYNPSGAADNVIVAAARSCPVKAINVLDQDSGTQLFPVPKK
jgi:ferredoxin